MGGGKAGRASLSSHPARPLPRSGQADLVAIYYERIDVEGHHYGPSSPQRKEALRAVDTVLKYMTTWIQVTENQAHWANLPSVPLLLSP